MNKRKPKLLFSILDNAVLAIIISIGVGFLFINNQITDFIIDQAIENNNNTAVAIEAYIEEKLNEPVNVLKSINLILLNNELDDRQINTGLNRIVNAYKYFEDIEIVTLEGKVLYTFDVHADEVGFDRSNELSIIQIDDNDSDIYWSNIQISPYSNTRTISITIKSDVGYIIGYLDLNSIQNESYEFISKLNKHLEIIITDNIGTYLVNKDISLVDERRIYPKIDYAKALLQNPSQKIYIDNNSDIILSSIQMNNTNWIINIEQTYASATALIDYFFYYFTIFIVIVIFTFTLVTFIGVKKIIRNISLFSKRLISFTETKEQDKHINYFQEFDALEVSYNDMVTSIAEKDLKLEKLAYYDSLTGMYNRTYLIDTIIPNFNENISDYVVIFIDLDNFSYINDTYGHHFGDTILLKFSNILKATFDEDILIRLGGDEFIIIASHKTRFRQYVDDKLSIVKNALEKPLDFSDNNIFLTFSAGYSQYPTDGTDFYIILKNADSAMYHAKSIGKNSSSYFVQTMKFEVERKLNIEQQLRRAIERNEFYLVYQPQLNVECTEIRGFEALLRWNNVLLGNILTPDFIQIAEENRFIIEIGAWVIEESCKFIKEINHDFSSNYIICINASPVELSNNHYVQNIEHMINEYNINPQWLEIEVTENISIEESNLILPQLNELKALGIGLAIDDFGTGYSSLSYLQNMPLDVLKIDRVFVEQMENDDKMNLMMQTIILLAKNLNLKIVAEGVETQEQIEILKFHGCEYVQGFLISKPISSVHVIEFIKTMKRI